MTDHPAIAAGCTPKNRCIYGYCRARNLCKGDHCVGYSLLSNEGLVIEYGRLRDATQEDRGRYLPPPEAPEREES
jgi:hypothetical protein